MPYEDSIQHLLVLFLEYKRARSQSERSRLDAEIMQLFDTLGASLSPEMLTVRGDFERMRNAPTPESGLSRQARSEARRFSNGRIARIERTPDAPVLTKGAKEMLRIPLLEVYELFQYRDEEEADRSFARIAESLREEPHSRREGRGRERTSIAVIRAYAKNFCNIPPLCSERDHE